MSGFSNTMNGPVGFQVTITAPVGREFLIPGLVKFVVAPAGTTLVFFSDEPYKKVLYHLDKYGFTYVEAGDDIINDLPQPGVPLVLVQTPTL